MSGKVVTLNGIDLPEPGPPVESLVTCIDELLERARNGDIHAVSYAMSFADGSTGHNSRGTVQNTYALIGRHVALIYDQLKSLEREDK